MPTLLTKYLRGLLLICIGCYAGQAFAAVTISEFMASNNSTITDEDGDSSDWIEIHNNGNAAVNINGWYLTDDDGDLTQWQLPNVTLPGNSYRLVFASNKDRTPANGELHTNFRLSAGGEYLALVEADGTTIATEFAPEYPQQFTDISFGGTLYFPSPTPGSANNAGVSGLIEPVTFSVDHGFYDTPQSVALTSDTPNTSIRYTLDGSTPSTATGCTPPANGAAWSWEYFEGVWTALPNFDALTPVSTGTAAEISIAPRQRDTNYGLRFNGCIEAEVDGLYTFEATSDDGSQVFVDGNLVVDNDGLHGPLSVSATIVLEAGLHSVTTTMFQGGQGAALSASWVSPTRSNGFVTTQDEGQFLAADPNSVNVIELPFDLATSGTFQFETLSRGVTGSSNSFWVQLNDGPLWLFQTPLGNNFGNHLVTDNGAAVAVPLTPGDHVLRFFVREDGTSLASVTVRGSQCAGPCEAQILEAEAGNIGGILLPAGSVAEPIDAERWFTYNAPITVDSTTTLRATAVRDGFLPPANASTATYLFLDDVVLQSRAGEPPEGWPAGPINEQVLNYGMDPEIVDGDPAAVQASLASLPAIAISTDIDNLMHPEIGIYTNAQERGRYWERPVSIELIDGSGAQEGFTHDGGLRIRGGFSRRPEDPKHAFRAFFRSVYAGDLEYPLFDDEGVDEFERIDFRSAQNYAWATQNNGRNTFLREIWGRDTQRAMEIPYTRSRYYNLYINGIYWGVFMTQERVTDEYAESYFGGEEDDYDVVKHSRSDGFRYEVTSGTTTSWNQIFSYVEDQTINAAEFAAIDAMVDLENLADYIMINAYEGDTDGSPSSFLSSFRRSNNWYAVRDAVGDRTKWRFFQHDGEHSMGARRRPDLENNLLGPYPPFDGQSNSFFEAAFFNPYWLHAALESNAEYRQRFIDRAAVHFRGTGALTDSAALERWNARQSEVAGAIVANSARWGDTQRSTPFTVNDWLTEVNWVENNFFPGRSDIVYAQLVALNLASNLPTPELSAPNNSLLAPGTEVTISGTPGTQIYYTLDGTDPRTVGGGIAPGALLINAGDSITINSDVALVLRAVSGSEFGPVARASFTVNAIPVIDDEDDQVTAAGDSVALQLSATDDDPLTWTQVGLPGGLAIDFNTGLITGTPTTLGSFNAIITVDDGSVSVDLELAWDIVPPAPLILNEYNAVSGSRFLGGGDNTTMEPRDTRLGRVQGNGGDWFELVVTEDNLDIRGWRLAISDDDVAQPELVFSDAPIWSDLRAGTIITVTEEEITAADTTVFAEDISYSPATGDFWINVVAGNNGSGEFISASNFPVSNDNWQLTIIDNAGNTVFGAAGEGIAGFGGVSSQEVGKLEEDPQTFITAGSDYDDGTSSTFGAPNLYADGTMEQDFSQLRPAITSNPIINVADATAVEGNFLRYLITLSEPANQDVTFDLLTTSTDATPGSDFLGRSGLRIIPAGSVERTIFVDTIDDQELESPERVTLTLLNLVGAEPGDLSAEGIIEDNEVAAGNLPQLSIADASTVEGGYARFVITLSEPAPQPVSFVLVNEGDTATIDADFTPKSGLRTIAAGAVQSSIFVRSVDDSDAEAAETFTLTLASITNATSSDNVATATILDNDGGINLPTISIGDGASTEGNFVRLPVTLSAPSTLPTSFVVTTTAVTATETDDYAPRSGLRTIAAGQTEFTLFIPTVDDTDSEGTETFEITISDVSNAQLGNATGTGTINDNEGAASPLLTVNDTQALEGTGARLTISLSQAVANDITVTIQTFDETAIGGGVDYATRGGARVIPAGSTEFGLFIPLPDDQIAEGDETFRLEVIDGGQATIVDGISNITIQDND